MSEEVFANIVYYSVLIPATILCLLVWGGLIILMFEVIFKGAMYTFISTIVLYKFKHEIPSTLKYIATSGYNKVLEKVKMCYKSKRKKTP